VPLPLPLGLAVIVIHESFEVAVQSQPAVLATDTLLPEAFAATLTDVGAAVKAHGAPACVTVTVTPAMVIVPVRGDVLGFAATS
jgi:hypothetical protein